MKKAVVSLAAVLMVLASFATPSFAAGNSNTYNGTRFSMSMNAPATVRAGQVLNVSGTLTLNDDGSNAKSRMLGYRLSTGLGPARSAFKAFPVGHPKSVTKAFTVPARIEPGQYTITFQVSEGGENGLVSVVVNVER